MRALVVITIASLLAVSGCAGSEGDDVTSETAGLGDTEYLVGGDDDILSDGSPVEWQIVMDDQGAGVHTVHMIVDFGSAPETSEEPGDRPFGPDGLAASGSLAWVQREVALCGISFRFEAGDGRLGVGDIFQTTEGCGEDPTAMQNAFDEFGMPTEGCVVATLDGVTYEYCAPLPIAQTSWRW